MCLLSVILERIYPVDRKNIYFQENPSRPRQQKSPTMSGVALKNINPSSRRRRRCLKHDLDLNRDENDLISNMDSFPVTPITPPAAFLPLGGFKHKTTRKKGENGR